MAQDKLPKFALFINSQSRQGAQALAKATELLKESGISFDDHSNKKPDEFCKMLESRKQEYGGAILGGGDGTMNSMLDTLVKHDIILGILPLGTANNFARNLDLPLDLAEAIAVIKEFKVKKIDVAAVNDVKFANVLGIGVSAKVNNQISPKTKRFFGKIAYIFSALKHIRRTRPFRVRIEHDGKTTHHRTLQVTVCHGRYYGSGITIDENARLDDGKLYLVSPRVISWWRGLMLTPALMSGRIGQQKPDILKISATSFDITTKKPRHVDADGEMVARTPATLRIHRQCLRVIAP